jgi:protein O-GlcNAc transferase
MKDEMEALRAALERYPDDHDGRLRLANKYFSRGQIDDAMAEMQRLVERDPSRRAMAYFNLGVGYTRKGMIAEAVVMFKHSLELQPRNSQIYYYLGCAYLSQGMNEEAEKEFYKALEVNPNHRAAYDSLGFLYMNCERYADAARIASQLLEQYPEDPTLLSNLGACYVGMDRIEEGLEHLEKALQVDSNDSHIYKHLAIAYEKKGMNEEAAKATARYNALAGVQFDPELTAHLQEGTA